MELWKILKGASTAALLCIGISAAIYLVMFAEPVTETASEASATAVETDYPGNDKQSGTGSSGSGFDYPDYAKNPYVTPPNPDPGTNNPGDYDERPDSSLN